MPRLVFPDDQLVYALQGNLFTGKPGTKIYIYTDALATVLADIQDMTNATIVGSYITVDSNSLVPLFQGPNDGRDTLYAKPEGGGTAQPIYARVDDRLDAKLDVTGTAADSSKLGGVVAAGYAQRSQGLFANRPVAGIAGRRYYATDQDREYLDDGAAWHQILTDTAANAAYAPIGSGLSSTAEAFTGNSSENTSSTTPADLTTVGPAVTVTVGASGRVLVMLGMQAFNSAAGNGNYMSVAVSGATTRAAATNIHTSVSTTGTVEQKVGRSFLLTGLTAGSNTFTGKYSVSAGTGTFSARNLIIIPL